MRSPGDPWGALGGRERGGLGESHGEPWRALGCLGALGSPREQDPCGPLMEKRGCIRAALGLPAPPRVEKKGGA